MKVLVSGFEPFGGQTVNSSGRAVAQLPHNLGGNKIETVILPVSYTRSDQVLIDRIRTLAPDVVVCVGQNAGAREIRVESTAGNYAHSETEDADHNLWMYRSIDMSGAPSYRATIPVEETAEAIQAAGVPAEVSHSAGTFVCNCLMYQLLRTAETEYPNAKCGFIHVPCIPEQCSDASQPSMPLESIVRGLVVALCAILGVDPAVAENAPADEPAVEAATPIEAVASVEAAAPVEEAATVAAAEPIETAAPIEAVAGAAEAVGEAVEVTAAQTAAYVEEVKEAAAEPIPVTVEPLKEEAPKEQPAPAESSPASAENRPAPAANNPVPAAETSAAAAGGQKMSAARAAAEYYAAIRRKRAEEQMREDAESEIYYGATSRHSKAPVGDARAAEIHRRLSESVPEKIAPAMTEEPQETLFAPPKERYRVDTSDYRVFSVKDKYRSADSQDEMTLTEYMDHFVPERVKTEAEIIDEKRRTLIHEGEDTRDERSYEERNALRKAAKEKEDAKDHIFFGEYVVLTDNMHAMGKTLEKSIMTDGEIHRLLYTSIEENGSIVGYHIVELEGKTSRKLREVGDIPSYASDHEKYYVFRALTEMKKIVCDPETYEIDLEKL
ncbi:MAG: hypothetical protein IK055_01110 [Lachnospiraceae bacterium]|nr:hypothetical protein [Lachnospiraceae bacterium]